MAPASTSSEELTTEDEVAHTLLHLADSPVDTSSRGPDMHIQLPITKLNLGMPERDADTLQAATSEPAPTTAATRHQSQPPHHPAPTAAIASVPAPVPAGALLLRPGNQGYSTLLPRCHPSVLLLVLHLKRYD